MLQIVAHFLSSLVSSCRLTPVPVQISDAVLDACLAQDPDSKVRDVTTVPHRSAWVVRTQRTAMATSIFKLLMPVHKSVAHSLTGASYCAGIV